ncbi:MAG: DUF1015 domain-containing protein [Planctomycetes bacterium]|nr:DUF1015 domain-containing protein [Planctomycetota bacterium]MBL7146606.1 DUF1015 domain-containing protein [Phycisphaerae bacterium]
MQIKPFKAFRFDKAVVGDLGSCIAPPYDVISDAQQEQLYNKSEHNIVRIIKGKTNASDNGDNNQYTRAAGYLNNWINQGALKEDATDTIYAYVQDFELGGIQFQRLSFIALARLEEFGEVVRPHEQILKKPMLDRLSLKKATTADFGLVFMLYEDEQEIADKIIEQTVTTEPLIDFIDEQNVRHRLFAITAEEDIQQIVKMMNDKSCVIADGHHRYTTGLAYSKESDYPAAKYQMLAFANISHKGLIVLATHRLACNLENFSFEKLITELKENFELTELKFDSPESKIDARQKMLEQMKAGHDEDENAFGIYGANNAFYVAVLRDKQAMDPVAPDMSPAWRTLDVSILHKLILEKILGIDEERLAKGENLQYVKDTPNAIDESIFQVDSGNKQAAFFMNPVKMQQLKLVTEAGERMPQKSTYFYPKIFTGLTIQKL